MNKVTFSQEPIGATIKIHGKLHVMYGKGTVTRTHENKEITEYIAYVDPAVTDNAEYIADRIVKLEAALAKSQVAEALERLTVTTVNGNTFDADLNSRQNLADGILASETTGQTEAVWRLANNNEVLVDVSELREAHALALQAYAATKAIG